MGVWAAGEVLGLDFETTGIDRFNDVPVSYALVSVVEGVFVRSWSGLIDPGREIPSDSTAVHGISSERARAEGMPLTEAMALVADAVVSASARGVPLAGMRLDYDLTILETQARQLSGQGIIAGMAGAGARRRGDRSALRPRSSRKADAGRPVWSLRHRDRERARRVCRCRRVDRGDLRTGSAARDTVDE